MTNFASCKECEAISQELHEAMCETRDLQMTRSRDACALQRTTIGGTEDDAVRAEDIQSACGPISEPSQINKAFEKKLRTKLAPDTSTLVERDTSYVAPGVHVGADLDTESSKRNLQKSTT